MEANVTPRGIPKPGACFCQAAFDCVDDGVIEDVTVTTADEAVNWLDGAVVVGDTPVAEGPVMGVAEDPPVLPGEFELAGGVEAGVDGAADEPGELDGRGIGGTEVDGEGSPSFIIVNSGLALPESPNTTMSNEHGATCDGWRPLTDNNIVCSGGYIRHRDLSLSNRIVEVGSKRGVLINC